MKIQDLRSEQKDHRARASATVVWEDCARPVEEVYFETEEEFAEGLTCNPHAFLVGCIIPAMHYGERRLSIEAEICPELRQGLITAMSWLRHWHYSPKRELVRIEAKTQARPPRRRTATRSGFFFSGGVDSFVTLRQNHLTFPPEHPGFIKDALLIYGLELDDLEAFSWVKDALSKIAPKLGVTLIPIYTNVYLNYRAEDAHQHFNFWREQFAGAALAATGHVLAKRLAAVSIASGDDIPNLSEEGTHPLLDPNYSSSDVRITHDGVHLSRREKLRLIAEWPLALENLRVCNHFKRYRPDRLNCGRCEKCLRTMLALLALCVLDRTPAFREDDVSAEWVLEGVKSIPDLGTELAYRESMTALAEQGRQDLVRAIQRAIARNRKKGWIGYSTTLGKKYFRGGLGRIKRWIA